MYSRGCDAKSLLPPWNQDNFKAPCLRRKNLICKNYQSLWQSAPQGVCEFRRRPCVAEDRSSSVTDCCMVWCVQEKRGKSFSGRARLKKNGLRASEPPLNGSILLASFSIVSLIPSADSVFWFVCLLFKKNHKTNQTKTKKTKTHKTLKTPICWKYTYGTHCKSPFVNSLSKKPFADRISFLPECISPIYFLYRKVSWTWSFWEGGTSIRFWN